MRRDDGRKGAKRPRSEPQASEGPEGWVLVGHVSGAHGLRGRLHVKLHTDLETLAQVRSLALDGPGEGLRRAVVHCEPGRAGEARVQLEGVSKREAAEALRGAGVWADPAELPALEPGEFYGYQLVGCRLEGEDGRVVGVIRGIWQTGAPDVLVVEAEDGREHLVPAALLREVDTAGRRAVAEILPGLLEEGGS